MSNQAEGTREHVTEWSPQPKRRHYVADAIAGGTHGYADYTDHDSRIVKDRPHASARSVYCPDVLMPGDHVKLGGSDDEGWRAERA